MGKSEEVTLNIDGRDVRITSPNKVFFSERGETKLDLVRFYVSIGAPFLEANRGRPTMLQRYPDGAEGNSFFQKRVPENLPDWLETTTVSTPNGTTSKALVLADMAHVAWAVNLGCLGFHPWPFRADQPHGTDELRIDLDPQDGVDFEMLREAAHETHMLFQDVGVDSYPKTTGNRGIHVYVALQPDWDSFSVRSCAVAVARELERRRPDLITAAWWKEERGTRVFVDFNQNAPHKTVFGTWCVRANREARVSAPFVWSELATINPSHLTIATVPSRLVEQGDPWASMYTAPQSLAPLLALHERDSASGLPDAPWPPVYPKMAGEPPRVAPSRAKKPKATG